MTSYSTMTVADLLDAFASNQPVPGGGSASALGGAVGISLRMMVAGLPKTKTGAPEEAADLAEAATHLRPLRDRLTALIEHDSEAYQAVIAAYRLAKNTDADKAARREAIDAAMRGATEVPLDTMRACQQALRGATIIANNGNKNASTDTGTGVELLLASLRGAGMNVDVNLAAISDISYTSRIKAEREELEQEGTSDAERARAMLQS